MTIHAMRLLLCFCTVLLAAPAWPRAEEPLHVPAITGPWTTLTGDPDLGSLSSEKQQPVDFAIWQAADGTWQLLSCVRGTKEAGKTRLLHRWESADLLAPDWKPQGIAMRAEVALGETAGGLQAPFVTRRGGSFRMLYGDWARICLARSTDGKTFHREKGANAQPALFAEGARDNARDPFVIDIGGASYCYYTAHPAQKGAVFRRKSTDDWKTWTEGKIVAQGGQAGDGPYAAECPFVVEQRPGHFYLFRTQKYGPGAETRVYHSTDPEDFGLPGGEGDARHHVTTLPVAAPEIVRRGDEWFIAALRPDLQGHRLARLEWRAPVTGALRNMPSAPAPAAPAEFSSTAVARQPSPRPGFQGEGFPGMRRQWDTPLPAPAKPASDARIEAAFRLAEKHARQANEAFYRSRRFIDGWLAFADPATGLIPRNLDKSRDFWNGRDSAADNWPFMVLTAAMTDRPLFEGRMLEMLRTETKLTCRVDRLPDDYSFSKKGWRREKIELDAIIFDGAEYVKDGLLPITEWLGPSAWSERAIGIVEDIWKHAPVETPFGKIPTLNFEVNGDLLQACSRLYWFTGERKYLDWAIRLGDYYLLGDHHPTRDMKELKLGDHSCEVINGLSELYVACAHAAPEKRAAYRGPLHEMYDRILEIARNEHGLVYLRVDNQTGKPLSAALTDNWGYNYDGFYTAWLLDRKTAYRDAVRKALGNLKAHYTGQGGMCQSGTADGYADSIEGAITLLNREPVASAMEWVDAEIKTMWSRQRPDGVIEGWHGDGNSARTSLMYALWKTQGVTAEPWRADVRFGAAREGDALCISVVAERPWEGRLVFDKQRHRLNMRLPLDYPRINQFPEWFTARAGARYEVRDAVSGEKRMLSGGELLDGLTARLKAGEEMRLLVMPEAGS